MATERANREWIQSITRLMRSGEHPLWVRLRELLRERGIDPDNAILAESVEDGEDLEYGVVVTKDRQVFEFELDFSEAPMEQSQFSVWRDVTHSLDAAHLTRRAELALEILAHQAKHSGTLR
jgi:hypothetical protein